MSEDPSMPTPELTERWRKMGRWERATERVDNLEWEIRDLKRNLRQAKRNLAFAKERCAEAKAALGELSVLERVC